MPVKARWEYHGIYYITSGVVTADEVSAAQRLAHSPPEGVRPQYQIIDARNTEKFDFDQMEIFNVSADDVTLGKKFPNFKIAFVTTLKNVEATFMDHLKISWSLNSDAEIRMFKTIDAAREWINLPFPKSDGDSDLTRGDTGTKLSLP
ncbi:MAG: hypothetical protein KJO04_03695 [Bacteroidia bacterium]|nr:hypothetical protein [Bacteroidia bacterium]